jgi:hypothetical protein
MRIAGMLSLLVVLMAFSAVSVSAQDSLNTTNATADLNITNATAVAEPVETISKYKQLSEYTKGVAVVLGKNAVQEYSDVTKVADRNSVFSREAGTTTPAVKVSITKVNTIEEKFVEVTNQAVGSWDLTGWKLASAGNATYTFPEFTLDMGKSVRVHEGEGAGNKAELYTNNTAPLWIDDEISLQNAEGNTISRYDLMSIPEETSYVNPLSRLIQY